jgi:hypothetical protein
LPHPFEAPHFFPAQLAGLGALFLCAAGAGLLLSLCGIFIAIAYFAQRVRAHALADAVEAEIASRVHALVLDAPPPLRVAYDVAGATAHVADAVANEDSEADVPLAEARRTRA